jgi:very-short-patch-repair endonuclease
MISLKTNSNARKRRFRRIKPKSMAVVVPRVIGDPPIFELRYPKCAVRRFADQNRRKRTPAEKRFEAVVNDLANGVLRGRFKAQHPISGKCIVDFFFPEIHLAVEIDGGYHNAASQRARDSIKKSDCDRFDITLLRLTNRDVFGNRTALVEKLRGGWRAAKNRKNMLGGLSEGNSREGSR